MEWNAQEEVTVQKGCCIVLWNVIISLDWDTGVQTSNTIFGLNFIVL